MTEKPAQVRSKSKKPSRNKSAIRIPISLHFYAVEIVVIILVVFIINIYIQSIVNNYIADQCNNRLEVAVSSTHTDANAFQLQLDASDERTEDAIRSYLINSVATSDELSTQANIALYYLNKDTGKFTVLWPTAYSTSYIRNATNIISKVVEEDGYKDLNKTQTLDMDGNIICKCLNAFDVCYS